MRQRKLILKAIPPHPVKGFRLQPHTSRYDLKLGTEIAESLI